MVPRGRNGSDWYPVQLAVYPVGAADVPAVELRLMEP